LSRSIPRRAFTAGVMAAPPGLMLCRPALARGCPDIAERVCAIVVEQLGVDPVKVVPAASFIDVLGADSLDTVEIVSAIGQAFRVRIPDDQAPRPC
jgi:acyl carrier protein